MNYYDTFITVSPDSKATVGLVPQEKKNGPSKHGIEYELLAGSPYAYTQEELLFEVHIRHKGIPPEELEARGEQLWNEFFQRSHACLRASMLPKKYGWGIHFDKEGKIALYGVESPEYKKLAENDGGGLKILAGMRSSRST
ncbi:DUF6157 family protein [Paenibacillus puerhi]|uniref:DUF6157 family protein n=1 Tax=Paenibacillus puerhi TaxID=2692622 RepID=UPI001356D507|nr:DUF6157 family protein [Paenibacillus puerhi]